MIEHGRTEPQRKPTPEYDRLFHFAAEYRDRGFSVVPVRGKVPAIEWKEFQGRRASEDELSTWFGEQTSEKLNVGIVTGAVSDLVVVDADSQDAIDVWEAMRRPTPLAVETGGGGMHFYYRHPGQNTLVKNQTGCCGERLDVRGDGGLVVAPPSVHPRTNRAYRWVTPIEQISLDSVPTYDSTWLSSTAMPIPQPFHSPSPTSKILRVRKYISHIVAVSGEGGHNSTYRATCRLKDAGLTPEEALYELELWSKTNAFPPWSTKELIHKVDSVFRGEV